MAPWPDGTANALAEALSAIRSRRRAPVAEAPSAWHARCGDVLSQCLGAGFVYGPVRRRWDNGALVVGANWRALLREPSRAAKGKVGSDPDSWPSPAAACSPFVEIVLRLLYDLRGDEWGALSRSVTRGLLLPGLAEHTKDAHSKAWRAYDFDHLPAPLPAALCLVLYRAHVVLLVDCDRVPVTRDGVRLAGLWVIGADGSFSDEPGERGVLVRRYSCQPLTCEPAAARADRQRRYPDRRRMFRVVGLLAPPRLPQALPRLVVVSA